VEDFCSYEVGFLSVHYRHVVRDKRTEQAFDDTHLKHTAFYTPVTVYVVKDVSSDRE